MTTKYVRVNYYHRPFPKYVPVKERKNGMQLIKNTLEGIMAIAISWLVLWALAYTACVGNYHSSICRQDITSQAIFSLIK